MAVFRVEKNKDYTVMSNYHLRETNMSLKAIGLLSKILSLPDNWDYTIAGLVSICKENETAIKSALSELKQFGYLEIIKRMPNQTKTGRIEYEYIIYESPKKQEYKKQEVEILPLENTAQLNTNKLNTNNDINNINIINIDNVEKEKNNKILNESIIYIVDYLNKTAGTKYKSTTKSTRSLIKARFKEGYKIDDFYDVIDKKYSQWKNTDMEKYIRPETLFGNKFENYLNEKVYFKGTCRTSYSSKPTFDNTINHNIPKGLSEMTTQEKQDFYNNDLAKDDNGNFLKF